MEKEIKRLGDAELEIMLAVWAAAAPVQSGYVQQHLRRSWPLPAVVTAMNRLVDKGFLSREKEGRVNLYRPLISEEDYKTAEGRGVLHRLYGDSVTGLVTALYDGKALGEEDLRELRAFLDGRGFLEVDTPILTPFEIGASARPFLTHHNTLDMDMVLRIETELYLKRLIVGGFERVYEVGRIFRNEGMDPKHNPEFTTVELYQAYTDFHGMMDLVEELVTTLAETVIGTLHIKHPNGNVINLERPWRRVTYRELVEERAGKDYFELDFKGKVARAKELGCDVNGSMPEFEVTNEIYEKLIER